MSAIAPRRTGRRRPADEGLAAALQAAGTASALAAALGITDGAISQWSEVPPRRVLTIEQKFNVPRWILRPDYYPPPTDDVAEAA